MSDQRFHSKAGEEYELFKAACPHFDELENTLGAVLKEKFADDLTDTIRVLEIGCGPGYTTLILLDADPRVHVVAVDNEHVMITQAEEILKDFIAAGRVTLIEADALAYPGAQPDNSFDVFASGFTLHNFANAFRDQVLTKIYRVLKPGGYFVNADKYALDDDAAHARTLAWQLQQFQDVYGKLQRPDLVQEWTTHYLQDNQPGTIMKEAVAIDTMHKIGFRNLEIVFRQQMEAVMVAEK